MIKYKPLKIENYGIYKKRIITNHESGFFLGIGGV